MSSYESTDDKRAAIGNETRHQYRTLTAEEKVAMAHFKDQGQSLIDKCRQLQCQRPEIGREMALAITKFEEAVMWAVKGLTK